MTTNEFEYLYLKYLKRLPNSSEVHMHLVKNYDEFEIELLTCDEKIMVDEGISHVPNLKIAILLCGHYRSGQVVHFLRHTSENIDIFCCTWDNFGRRGTERNLHESRFNDIEKLIVGIPRICDYKIGSNKEYVESILPKTYSHKYFNYSAPELYIKSQLHTINESYKMMENYSKKNLVNYDLVIKLRFDCGMRSFLITPKTLQYIRSDKAIFVTNEGQHRHPFYSNACTTCNTMYDIGMKEPHLGNHSNIICDFLAYGSKKSMKKYCSMIDVYDDMNDAWHEENRESGIKKGLLMGGGISSRVNHIDSLFHFICSYPERMSQLYLRDYMLISSRYIITRHFRW